MEQETKEELFWYSCVNLYQDSKQESRKSSKNIP